MIRMERNSINKSLYSESNSSFKIGSCRQEWICIEDTRVQNSTYFKRSPINNPSENKAFWHNKHWTKNPKKHCIKNPNVGTTITPVGQKSLLWSPEKLKQQKQCPKKRKTDCLTIWFLRNTEGKWVKDFRSRRKTT